MNLACVLDAIHREKRAVMSELDAPGPWTDDELLREHLALLDWLLRRTVQARSLRDVFAAFAEGERHTNSCFAVYVHEMRQDLHLLRRGIGDAL